MKKFLTIVLASTLQLGLFAGSGWQVRCFKNENSPYTQCKAVKVVPGGGGVNVLNNPKNSGRQNANNHYATKSNQTTVNSAYIPYREDADTVRDDISGVARDLMKDLDGYCRSEEASFPIYRKRDANGNLKYYPKTGKTFHSRDSVPMNYPGTDENGGELVAIVHNHPVDKNGVSLSVGDVMAAINMNVRVYAGGCKQGISPDNRGLVYVDSENGYIHSISGTDDIGLSFRKSGPDEVCPVGGFDFKKSLIVGDDVCIPIRDNFKIPENITDKDFEDKFARMAYHPNYFKEMSRYAESRKLRKKQSGENAQLASAGNAPETGTPRPDLDAGKTIVTDETNTNETSSEVGIRGWCKCKEKRETSGARGDMVGIAGTIFGIGIGGDESAPMARYLYTFCRYCGKCRQPELDYPDHSYTPNIWDNQLEMQLAVTNGLRTCDYVNARKAVERKFMKIPDGQIVFPGKCTCKRPDPIRDGFHTTCVCVKCGRYYESE